MLKLVEEAWLRWPDMRLGQLVAHATDKAEVANEDEREAHLIEDTDLERGLEKMAGMQRPPDGN